ncbi:23S rRNA (guanosine(2251)-2'-O)-methyltransferase RlmB [Actinorhabdospora filicis]|uniref:23S rRNA (Guanosine(2251)-2'-O)-methyltransferase RlmB n=1 Tax=Actinorhabdospora filicis TaxID=1785913 RepID=A0A9W6SIK5_9ACTN|nr:23S rRNA (guanosine(2251)-2'-O)-methyltransferase RlmB [Actinorhabdospora filicis]GLZ76938.1 23S rRNA (guanosine(2251)-2'-O)-methyltransferase RlmB [Actinorhabdospora filicis]
MAGNSQRRGRRTTAKKGPAQGSGGQGKKALEGRGKTLGAQDRPWHKEYTGEDKPKKTRRKQERVRREAAAEGRVSHIGKSAPTRQPIRRKDPDTPEVLVGRNPVVEALRGGVPATALYVARGIEIDERVREAIRVAGNKGIAILEVSRAELDRMCNKALHQGVGLQVPAFHYEPLEDVLAIADEQAPGLLVALDGVTDPRNLGAIVRSAAAFGAHGVFVPERRAASVTATAWRASAGAAARMPIARVVNMTRALKQCQEAGYLVIGLDADGELELPQLEAAVEPLVIVVGSEGRGLSRLVAETCDLRVSIPMANAVESLNASVAASVTLAEVARRRAARLVAV